MKIFKGLRIEEDLVKSIQKIATKQKRSWSYIVNELLSKAVKK